VGAFLSIACFPRGTSASSCANHASPSHRRCSICTCEARITSNPFQRSPITSNPGAHLFVDAVRYSILNDHGARLAVAAVFPRARPPTQPGQRRSLLKQQRPLASLTLLWAAKFPGDNTTKVGAHCRLVQPTSPVAHRTSPTPKRLQSIDPHSTGCYIGLLVTPGPPHGRAVRLSFLLGKPRNTAAPSPPL